MTDTPRSKLAVILYEMFEMRFSRHWDDLPQDVKNDWLANADSLGEQLQTAGLIIQERTK